MTRGVTTSAGAELPEIVPLGQTAGQITDRVLHVTEGRPGWGWLAAFGVAMSLSLLGVVSIGWLFISGVGIWGINIPVAWGFAITNFVWWIGIGHAGTLISAILLLARQKWRNSINRFAEAMTLFAIAMAGLMPILHLGRPNLFYYLVPYPNTMNLWPQFRSALVFDFFAITTYGLVSLYFWYLGLIPDLATLREHAKKKWIRVMAGIFALGWRGSARHWQRHQTCYLLLAGLATPLVVSVHSIVSIDFAEAIVPGWHTTIFPPYFVAGAIYSGFAMVLTITVPLRAAYRLHDIITERHLNNLAILMLVTGLIVSYSYVMEFFTAWYSAVRYDRYTEMYRVVGDYWPVFVLTMSGNVAAPMLLWFRRVRRSAWTLFLLSLLINVSMWSERYMIVITSLHRDYLPSAWDDYHGTFWDWSLLAGTLGMFATAMLLFVRFVPAVPIHEVRELMHEHHGSEPFAKSRAAEIARPPAAPLAAEELHGLIAEYDTPEKLIAAAKRVRQAGYRRIDAYTPFHVQRLAPALRLGKSRMPPIMLLGGMIGALSGYAMQWYASTIDYPWNVGGRPLHSWPSFIPITFELGVLGAATFGFFGLLALNRFPQPYHPVMNASNFSRALRDRFLLCIEQADKRFERDKVRVLLETTGADRVEEVRR